MTGSATVSSKREIEELPCGSSRIMTRQKTLVPTSSGSSGRAGIEVAIDKSEHHMHHKFAVFDRCITLTGSYNWTRSAAEFNEENILVTHDPRIAGRFQEEFNCLWKKLR